MSAAAKMLLALVLVLAGAAGGWTAQGWRKDLEIADLKRADAEGIAAGAAAALADLQAATSRINTAAAGARVDLAQLGTRLDAIRKDFNDAKAAPLPPDCRPDAVRVRKLTAAATAVDEAIARSVAGGSVPAERPAAVR